MILSLIIFGLIALLFVGWIRRLALQGQLQKLRTDYSRLREDHSAVSAANETLKQGYQDMRNLAAESIKLAHEKHFTKAPTLTPSKFDADSLTRTQSDYVPPEVKNCPKCAVSVRASEWPQKCPACAYLFGDVLDADVIE